VGYKEERIELLGGENKENEDSQSDDSQEGLEVRYDFVQRHSVWGCVYTNVRKEVDWRSKADWAESARFKPETMKGLFEDEKDE
jgi:hypothetical protein